MLKKNSSGEMKITTLQSLLAKYQAHAEQKDDLFV